MGSTRPWARCFRGPDDTPHWEMCNSLAIIRSWETILLCKCVEDCAMTRTPLSLKSITWRVFELIRNTISPHPALHSISFTSETFESKMADQKKHDLAPVEEHCEIDTDNLICSTVNGQKDAWMDGHTAEWSYKEMNQEHGVFSKRAWTWTIKMDSRTESIFLL